MPDIFLSYNREDQARAKLFADAFKAQGLDVWWDTALTPGEAYDQVTEKALKTAKAVVVLWSKKSVVSRWVRAEATLADRNKTLIPCMIEPCERPIMFELTQTAELAHWEGATDDPAWAAFVGGVKMFVERDARAASKAEATVAFALTAAALATAATPPKDADPILTVLPFDNLSMDPELQFFSDGISEEIIHRLSRGANLKVIGRTSSFQFRGEKKSEAARTLKCSHLLDGSVRRAGARVRIAAHLVEAASHTTLWSEHYDRGLDDTFAVQDEISEAIAGALHQTFTSFSTKAIDPAAYDLYLRSSIKLYAPAELHASIGLLEAALQRAPNFAEAWGRLAYVRGWARLFQPFAERAAFTALMRREAERALALDPQNVDALTAQYFNLPPYGSFIASDAAMERVRLAPGRGEGAIYIGWHARTIGRTRECAEITEDVYSSDPLNPMWVVVTAMARMAVGQVAEAIPLLQDLIARVPGMTYPVATLLRAFALLNDWPAVDRLLAPAADLAGRDFVDGLNFVRAKRNPTAENIGAIRDALEAHVAKTGSVDVTRLVYAAHLGLVDDVYRLAEWAHLGPRGTADDVIGADAYRTGMLFWRGMPEIRNDPRFVRLCARLGLVEFWLATQKWPDCVDEVPYDFKTACEKARSIPKEAFAF